MNFVWIWLLFATFVQSDPTKDVRIAGDALDLYHNLERKEKKNHPLYLTFKVDSGDQVWVEHKGWSDDIKTDDEAWFNFVSAMKDAGQPRFGISSYRNKVIFASWKPMGVNKALQLRYDAIFNPFKNAFSGLDIELEAHNIRKSVELSNSTACSGNPKAAPGITQIMDLTMQCVEEMSCSGYGTLLKSGTNGTVMTEFVTYESVNITVGNASGSCHMMELEDFGFNKTFVDFMANAQMGVNTEQRSMVEISKTHACIGQSHLENVASQDDLEKACMENPNCEGYGVEDGKFYIFEVAPKKASENKAGVCFALNLQAKTRTAGYGPKTESVKVNLQKETDVGNDGSSYERLKDKSSSTVPEMLSVTNRLWIFVFIGVCVTMFYRFIMHNFKPTPQHESSTPLLVEAQL